jgi:DNA invertase Pin-like site-specific DNA recombinase
MIRVALYARYSTDKQSDASVEDQLRECRRHCARQDGWTVAAEYGDHAMSGETWQRPEFQRLLRDARAGKFDLVVAEGLDRLSRDQADAPKLYKLLTFADVRIVTLAEGEISELQIGFKGTMNAMFLKDLRAKTRRGQRGRIMQGRVASGLAYGYRVIPAVKRDERGQREIVPAEAEVVRRIFRQYAAGISPEKIAKQLNREGIRGPRAATWGASSIHGTWQRGTGIINNEVYVGRLVWGKLQFRKDPETGSVVSRRSTDIEQHDVPELRIVDDALWQAVKARQLKTRKTRADRPMNRPVHLLSGLTVCGVCGGSFAVQYRTHLCCRNRARQHTCDNKRAITRAEVEARVLKAMQKFVSIEAFNRFCEVYVAHVNEARREVRQRTTDVPKEIEENEKQQMEMLNFMMKGIGIERLTLEVQRLEARHKELKALVAAGADDKKPALPALHPRMARDFQQRTAGLIAALDNGSEEQKQRARDTLRGFIEKIIIPPSGPLQVVGNLGELLTAATGWDGETLDKTRMTADAKGARFRCCQALHIIAA